MHVAVGALLSERWELLDRLAVGGMGDVYEALDHHLDQRVAVKVLRPGVTKGEARFTTEIATLRRVEHPGVVSLLDAGEHEGLLYLVMQLVPGGRSLAEELEDGPLRLERASEVGAQLAAALAAAHEQGIVHRDIKPSNVLLEGDGDVRLADFGIARLEDAARITETGVAVGTASYVAPEQLSPDAEVGPSADVYAIALLLLHALTGAPEFRGSVAEVVKARMMRAPEVPDGLPPGWRRLLAAMLEPEPADRPTAAVVARLLEAGCDPREVREAVAVVAPRSAAGRAPVTLSLGRGARGERGGRGVEGARRRSRGRWALVSVGVVLAAALVAASVRTDPSPAPDEIDAVPADEGGDELRGEAETVSD